MSKKTNLASEFTQLANQRGGSHATKESRAVTARDFFQTMKEARMTVRTVDQIGIKEMRVYAEKLSQRGLSRRTIANRLSHVRSAVTAVGKGQMLKEKTASNKALGASGGSRIGTHKPMSNADYQRIHANLAKRNPQAAVIMELQRALGLRQQEALKGATRDNLKQWEKQLKEGYARVEKGTKGGRVRETVVKSYERAVNAVQNALKSIKNGSGVVLDAKDYKTALNQLKNDYRASGMTGELSSHSLRYAWSQEQYQTYKTEGMSDREARAELSQDLGHGDGRGRYVAMVYLRK